MICMTEIQLNSYIPAIWAQISETNLQEKNNAKI